MDMLKQFQTNHTNCIPSQSKWLVQAATETSVVLCSGQRGCACNCTNCGNNMGMMMSTCLRIYPITEIRSEFSVFQDQNSVFSHIYN